ncbi:hypothetical protein EDB86DRAFT_598352 [Lactarius hatsudake]|nr:hypothetical protein EDB86DRAFT_598352 [Lactarius hatsudake]
MPAAGTRTTIRTCKVTLSITLAPGRRCERHLFGHMLSSASRTTVRSAVTPFLSLLGLCLVAWAWGGRCSCRGLLVEPQPRGACLCRSQPSLDVCRGHAGDMASMLDLPTGYIFGLVGGIQKRKEGCDYVCDAIIISRSPSLFPVREYDWSAMNRRPRSGFLMSSYWGFH